MTTGATGQLGLALPVQGELSGSWGNTVNNAITEYTNIAIAGTLTLSDDGAVTLTNTTGNASTTNITASSTLVGAGTATAQFAIVKVTGTLTATKVVTVGTALLPAYSKSYIVDNTTATFGVTFKAFGQTGITVAAGEKCTVYFNGTDYVKVASSVVDGVSTISFGSTGLTPATATSGAVTVAGTLAVLNGGTGTTTSTGSGNVVLSTSPTLVTPALGTPSALVGTNITGTAAGLTAGNVTTNANLTGAVTSVGNATSLGSFTSAQLATALTDETGSGASVFANSPTLTGTPLAPTATTGTNTTQLATTAFVQNQIGAISSGVVSFSAGTTGLTPSTATSGVVTLAGTLAVANGGTGQTSYTDGQLLIGNTTGNTLTKATLTQGTGISITNGSGAITISATGGGVSAATPTALGTVYGQTPSATTPTFLGYEAGLGNTGTQTTAVGYQALKSSNTAQFNTAFGWTALLANTSGDGNVALGAQTLKANTLGLQNVAVGTASLNVNTTGAFNVAVGQQVLQTTTVGSNNVGIGTYALYTSTSDNNTAVGYRALELMTTGSNNTAIGYYATATSTTVNNEFTLGNSSVATLRCQVTTITSLSDARDKTNINEISAGLEFVDKLRPVSFEWNMRDGGKVGVLDTGFIAQDLQQAQKDTGVIIPGLVYESNPDKLEAGYGKLLPVLVKAIQELSVEVKILKAQLKGA